MEAAPMSALPSAKRNAPAPSARTSDVAPVRRPIRSYVLRQGRLTPAQQRARERLLPRFGILFARQALDFDAAFGRSAPRILEIGSGMGETTAGIAKSMPDHDFLAIEVHGPGVGSLLRHIDDQALTNIRIVQHDAVEVVEHMIARETLAAIHVFFPDPWPKKRHHKRRLLQPGFVHELALRLMPRGWIHVATDWEDYAAAILQTLESESLLANTAAGYAERPAHRPVTKFERRGQGLGHRVWDMVFRRR
jgi:tRNA (guanine-N7-)-methyltransferase